MWKEVLPRFGLTLLMGAALAACGDDSNQITQPTGSGRLSIALTDAPAITIAAAVVTITDIYLQSGSDSLATADRVYLRRNQKTTVDLLTLRSRTQAMVENATVPAGSYSQLRFVVTGAYIQVRNADGSYSISATSPDYEGLPPGAQVTGTLVAPSCAGSGLSVDLPGERLDVADNSSTSLVADFDVAQSFGYAGGNVNGWVLSPVIRATTQSPSASLQVSVGVGEGAALPPGVALSAFQLQLIDALGNRRLAPLDTKGSAGFEGLPISNGPFTLALIAPAGYYATASPRLPLKLQLEAGGNTQQVTITNVTTP